MFAYILSQGLKLVGLTGFHFYFWVAILHLKFIKGLPFIIKRNFHVNVIKMIGQGGFGNVELVEDNGISYARKTFSPNQPLDDLMLANVRKRFAKEVRVQKAISHSNIVEIVSHDLNVHPPHYLMMVADGNLYEDLESNRTLNGDFVSAISDIVAGLEELHSMEIYHRDLKPQNVLRFQAGENGNKAVYKISDFGLISMRESSLSGLTKTGMRKGSDHYTAPEIARSLKSASAQSDIYSLGCILHDMVGTEDRVPCGEIKEAGPFEAILRGCTRIDPVNRFKTVRAVLDAILSVEFNPTQKPSAESAQFITVLTGNELPETNFWDELSEFLELESSLSEHPAIFGKMSAERIRTLCKVNQRAANQIGEFFAQWIGNTTFNFELCDALANRLEEFFNNTGFNCKIECLMAMLELGNSHNRWFVQHKFVALTGHEMDLNLAKRLAVQFRVEGDDICQQVDKLTRVISFERSTFHTVLFKAVGEICS